MEDVLEGVPERWVSRAGMERLLDRVDVSEVSDGVSLYIGPGPFQQRLATLEGQVPKELKEIAQRAPGLAASPTGAALFWSKGRGLAILPPFPVERDQVLEGWDTSQLRALLAREYTLGVVLLRLGRYAIGVLKGDALITSKTGTRYVKGRHHAGGQSQKRFQRIREKQVQEIFTKACGVVKEQFAPWEKELDYIFLGGERFTLNGFIKACDYLRSLSAEIHSRVLNVREPRHVALEKAIEAVWESRVVSIGTLIHP